MLTVIKDLLPLAEHHRAYLYRVFLALATACAAAGYISATKLGILVGIVSTVLAVPPGLAAANTSTKKRNEDGAVDLGFALGILFAVFLFLGILIELGYHPHL